jgi:hypothetical protein
VQFAVFPEEIYYKLQKVCQREAHGDEVRNSRAQQLDVLIVPGKVVAVHVFLCTEI